MNPESIHWHTLDQFTLERHFESADKALSAAAEAEKERRKNSGGGARLPLSPGECPNESES